MAYGTNPYYYSPTPYGTPQNGTYAPVQPPYGNLYGQTQQMAQNPQQMAQTPYYQQQYNQPQPQQAQQSQVSVPIKDIRFVTSEEAKAFIVMPNSNALLIDTANGMAFLKSADGIGQSVTKTYKFSEVGTNGQPIKSETIKQEMDYEQFVKRSDIADYIQQYGFVTKTQYEALQAQLDSLKQQIQAATNVSMNNSDRGNGNGRKQQQQQG